MLKQLLLLLFSFCILSAPRPGHAETKVLTAEGTYTMGEGETMTFAESMALQKAKQMALEQAGTYVESYTKVQNYQLTADEIQTIAGGVLQVEVLDKTRTLVGDGLKFFAKIKATVTTDKVSELAERIKGKNVAEEYAQLQAEYTRLHHELETWKKRAAKAPQGHEREAALSQIREGEKAFALAQKREDALFQRLVSGAQLVAQAKNDKDVVDELLQTIVTSGYLVAIGEMQAVAVPGEPDMLALNVPLTIRISETLTEAMSQVARALGGTMRSDVEVQLPQHRKYGWHLLRIGTDTRGNVKVSLVRLGKYRETAQYFQDRVMKLSLLVTFLDGTSEPFQCRLGPGSGHSSLAAWIAGESLDSATDRFLGIDAWNDEWLSLRRIFPVDQVTPPGKTFGNEAPRAVITNGWYDQMRACEETLAARKACRSSDLRASTEERRAGLDIPAQHGYVAIVRDEATFVARLKLHAKIARDITSVDVRVLSGTAQDEPHLKRVLPCTITQ